MQFNKCISLSRRIVFAMKTHIVKHEGKMLFMEKGRWAMLFCLVLFCSCRFEDLRCKTFAKFISYYSNIKLGKIAYWQISIQEAIIKNLLTFVFSNVVLEIERIRVWIESIPVLPLFQILLECILKMNLI